MNTKHLKSALQILSIEKKAKILKSSFEPERERNMLSIREKDREKRMRENQWNVSNILKEQ